MVGKVGRGGSAHLHVVRLVLKLGIEPGARSRGKGRVNARVRDLEPNL